MNEHVPSHFIEEIIENDLKKSVSRENLRFRFPPEPNGYLHIGHAKAICLNFELSRKYGTSINLRFDDTNPTKEGQNYVNSIKKDILWLGFKWDKECYASDYFEQLYQWAKKLIWKGKAYVDEQSQEVILAQRKTPFEAGIESPYRRRSIKENIELLERMRAGEFEEGQYVLRAKIDMNSPNMNLRDPIMYRILKKSHHRIGKKWCIYPTYDWTHGQSDYIEQISHSLCSIEFENHRPLYNWYLDQIYEDGKIKPRQCEFSRLNLSYTIMSKRKLQRLIEKKYVQGWNDPRLPTLSGFRRRGYSPEAIREFCNKIGVTKRDNVVDISLLEFSIRKQLNKTAPRVMVILDPIKLVIENYPPKYGIRNLPFSKRLYIEREDFMEVGSKKFFRLCLGGEVRLKNAYIIKGISVIKDYEGKIIEVHSFYDYKSLSGSNTKESLRKIKGTLHWVSSEHSIKVEVRLYDRLFSVPFPDGNKERDFMDFINPNSLKVVQGYGEPSLREAKKGNIFQFQRLGYFCVDPDTYKERIIFNRTVTLKDSWKKVKQ
ncbi:glutamine--tRNA ligase/YqeY domain fusion protein [Candidatus Walczuchella monophlebidarum]|uniref:Glutamine--tRNA ligase n=1 Tax=Candidatus Walczuchella monophlebidarum TaxID=1415657 RepID=A0A068DRV2_9FLAO|nr:glutamine--tRNA ligase/YqeY domain fusion protein [Candidatus Walczuchella monophlebidarum]AID37326.1 glutaminyl-tRNA synthetase [Candidatus Walczuchella monophlebidarum]